MHTFLSLSDDLVVKIATALSPAAYARLRGSCGAMRQLLTTAHLIQERGAPETIKTLEALALLEAVSAIGGNHVTFEGAITQLKPGFGGRLAAYAELLKRFGRAHLHIDAHTGRNAPSTYAPSFTRDRARTVRQELEERGVHRARVTCTGWGKIVAVHAGWPVGQESARGELYVEQDRVFYPARPAYYASVADICPPASSASDDEYADSEEEFEDDEDDVGLAAPQEGPTLGDLESVLQVCAGFGVGREQLEQGVLAMLPAALPAPGAYEVDEEVKGATSGDEAACEGPRAEADGSAGANSDDER
jgi:hypothetical protein